MDPSEEILDVFDEQGVHQGVAPRHRVHAEGLWHKTAQVWLINTDGELLLQLRSAHKKCFPNLWDISSAGHIPAGDKPLDSAVRELEEELGVCVGANDLRFIFNHKAPYVGENHVDREIAYVYLLPVKKNLSLTLQESEVADVKWVPWRSLLDDFYKHRGEFVAHEEHFKKLTNYLEENFEDLVK